MSFISEAPESAWIDTRQGILVMGEKLQQDETGRINWRSLWLADMVAFDLLEPTRYPVAGDLGESRSCLSQDGYDDVVLVAQVRNAMHFPKCSMLSLGTKCNGQWLTLRITVQKDLPQEISLQICKGPRITNFGKPLAKFPGVPQLDLL